jgi:hypothetical protein
VSIKISYGSKIALRKRREQPDIPPQSVSPIRLFHVQSERRTDSALPATDCGRIRFVSQRRHQNKRTIAGKAPQKLFAENLLCFDVKNKPNQLKRIEKGVRFQAPVHLKKQEFVFSC